MIVCSNAGSFEDNVVGIVSLLDLGLLLLELLPELRRDPLERDPLELMSSACLRDSRLSGYCGYPLAS